MLDRSRQRYQAKDTKIPSKISFVVLDKLLFGFPERSPLAEVNQAI